MASAVTDLTHLQLHSPALHHHHALSPLHPCNRLSLSTSQSLVIVWPSWFSGMFHGSCNLVTSRSWVQFLYLHGSFPGYQDGGQLRFGNIPGKPPILVRGCARGYEGSFFVFVFVWFGCVLVVCFLGGSVSPGGREEEAGRWHSSFCSTLLLL